MTADHGLLVAGGTVLAADDQDTILDRGWIRVRDGAIIEVSGSPIEPEPGEDVIDAGDRLVLPGFVNTHTHLFQILFRGVYEERSLATYLSYIYRSGLELTPDDERAAAVLASIEAIRSGVTTLVDHHFLNRTEELACATVEGMRDVGIRAVLARTIMDMGDGLPAPILERPDDGLKAVERLLDRFRDARASGMVSIWTGPNTPGMNASARAAVASREFAEAHGIRRSAHVAEYLGVVASVKRLYGIDGVVRWLDDIGALGPDLLAVHGVQVSREEVHRLASSGASVSHNPFSNVFCGDRNAPVSDYLHEGMSVGLGTDGDANNNGATVLEALRLTRLLQRLHPDEPMAIGPAAGLRMATAMGAAAAGMGDLTGTIQTGKRADIIVVDVGDRPHTSPVHDKRALLMHAVKPSDTRTVIVDGRVLMRDRQLLTVDEPAAIRSAQLAATRVVEQLS
jgi:5-methylthioadenosine/S-adenosylhomocysteine deaminase